MPRAWGLLARGCCQLVRLAEAHLAVFDQFAHYAQHVHQHRRNHKC